MPAAHHRERCTWQRPVTVIALIDAAGGTAFLYGHSSGATLAMRAAVALGGNVSKLAMYEAPHNGDPDAQASWTGYRGELERLLADGRRGDAVALFMRLVGTPEHGCQFQHW